MIVSLSNMTVDHIFATTSAPQWPVQEKQCSHTYPECLGERRHDCGPMWVYQVLCIHIHSQMITTWDQRCFDTPLFHSKQKKIKKNGKKEIQFQNLPRVSTLKTTWLWPNPGILNALFTLIIIWLWFQISISWIKNKQINKHKNKQINKQLPLLPNKNYIHTHTHTHTHLFGGSLKSKIVKRW